MSGKSLYAALLLFFLLLAVAQNEKIQGDRPGVIISQLLTKRGFFQFEMGLEKQQQNKDDYSLIHPVRQLKHGLSRRFEIRAEVSAESENNSVQMNLTMA